jgi:hypothetical protein
MQRVGGGAPPPGMLAEEEEAAPAITSMEEARVADVLLRMRTLAFVSLFAC